MRVLAKECPETESGGVERVNELTEQLDTAGVLLIPASESFGRRIGVLQRVFVMDCVKEENAAPQPMVMINPEITWSSEETNTYEEGCLSIPDQYAEVTRPKLVRMKWLNIDGKVMEEEFDGLWATCAQHELDHLDGKLFIDYLGPMKRKMITSKMQKLKRERARAPKKDGII